MGRDLIGGVSAPVVLSLYRICAPVGLTSDSLPTPCKTTPGLPEIRGIFGSKEVLLEKFFLTSNKCYILNTFLFDYTFINSVKLIETRFI